MKRIFALVIALMLAVTVPYAQTLSDQVLLLLSRVNSWTAAQTFTDVTITGTCTGCGGAGGGTVTSVALAATQTAIFDVTGSPIVGSGTLTLALDAQADNLFLAGPASSGPTIPTFRAIVDGDVPDTITIAGTDNVTWTSVNKTGSSLADLATKSAAALDTGELALARLTDGATAGVPLVAGGGGGDPNYAALNLASATSITGLLAAANFPALTGDITTAGSSLATTLSNTGVAAATYGSSTAVGQFTVNAKGRITSASNVTIGTANLLSATFCADCTTSAPTRGDIMYVPVGGTWDDLPVGTSGQFLRTDGTDVAWGVDGSALTTLNASNISSGTLALARGGTAASLTAVNGGVIYSTASALAVSAAGSVGECLTSNGAAAPTWGACATLASHDLLSATHGDTSADAVTRGSIIYGNSSPAWDELVIGGSGTFLRSDGTDVSWSANGSALTSLNASNLASGTVPTAVLPTIPVTKGGTGLTTVTTGDLLYASATDTMARLADVAVGQVLVSGGVGVAPAYSATPTLAELNLTTELNVATKVAFSATAPTISSGFGTTPSVSANNGTISFRVDVGTGGSATSGVLTLPTATAGWNCWVDNLTAQAANDSDERTVQTADTTTSATLENQTVSTGAAVAWTASDILMVSCFAF